MARKSEQQLTLEEQKRFFMGCMRKARIHKHRMDYAKRIAAIDAQLYPNPIDDAVAVAKAAKLQLKAQKVAAVEAKRAEAAELERQKEIERQKMRDENNPVIEQLRRGRIQAEQRKEQSVPVTEVVISDVVPAEDVPAINPPSETSVVTSQPDGVVVSPELITITREAEASAKRQSSIKRDDGLLDFLMRATQPLESRDEVAIVPPRRYVPEILTESSGPGETFARLGGYNTTPEPAEPVESGYLEEWNWVPKKW